MFLCSWAVYFYLSCVNKSMCRCPPLCRVQICGQLLENKHLEILALFFCLFLCTFTVNVSSSVLCVVMPTGLLAIKKSMNNALSLQFLIRFQVMAFFFNMDPRSFVPLGGTQRTMMME